jgi:hypothetical protein
MRSITTFALLGAVAFSALASTGLAQVTKFSLAKKFTYIQSAQAAPSSVTEFIFHATLDAAQGDFTSGSITSSRGTVPIWPEGGGRWEFEEDYPSQGVLNTNWAIGGTFTMDMDLSAGGSLSEDITMPAPESFPNTPALTGATFLALLLADPLQPLALAWSTPENTTEVIVTVYSTQGQIYEQVLPGSAMNHQIPAGTLLNGQAHAIDLAFHNNTLFNGTPGEFGSSATGKVAFVKETGIEFETLLVFEPYCFGDGTGAPCPCLGQSLPGEGCPNSGGVGGAILSGGGVASIANDSFQLDVSGVPGNKPGLILRGSNQANGGQGNLIGDGLLCTTANTARSHVQVTSAGSTTFIDFQGNPFGSSSIGAGVQTNYQFWYRDAANTCTGQGFNFSNALSVIWMP